MGLELYNLVHLLTCHSRFSPAPLSLSGLIWTPSPLHTPTSPGQAHSDSPCLRAASSSRQVSRLSILFLWPEFSSLSSSICRPCSCRIARSRSISSLWDNNRSLRSFISSSESSSWTQRVVYACVLGSPSKIFTVYLLRLKR